MVQPRQAVIPTSISSCNAIFYDPESQDCFCFQIQNKSHKLMMVISHKSPLQVTRVTEACGKSWHAKSVTVLKVRSLHSTFSSFINGRGWAWSRLMRNPSALWLRRQEMRRSIIYTCSGWEMIWHGKENEQFGARPRLIFSRDFILFAWDISMVWKVWRGLKRVCRQVFALNASTLLKNRKT